MGYFICLVRVGGEPVSEDDQERASALLRERGLRRVPWVCNGSFAATAVGTRLPSSPSIATVGSLIIVGTVRLDNRDELALRLGTSHAVSDLEIVGAFVQRHGARSLAQLTGDFAFACWDDRAKTFLAVRDSVGVRHLFWTSIGADLVACGSHASLLPHCATYSREYIAHLFAGAAQSVGEAGRSEELTIYEGVQLVPAGSSIRLQCGRIIGDRYWSVDNVPPSYDRLRSENCDEFRELFVRAVRLRLPDSGSVWAELSGGLDTSSIVMTSAQLNHGYNAPAKIAGTVTYSDTLGGGNESEYVQCVLSASGLPNCDLNGHWPWQDDGGFPPLNDLPNAATIFWARERRRDDLLKGAGADVLLSGAGGDYVLESNRLYMADWMARGRFLTTCREIIRSSALARESFWKCAFANALVPLLPAVLRSRFTTRDDWVIPPWVNAKFRKQYGISHLARSRRVYGLAGKGNSRYREAFAHRLKAMAFTPPLIQPSVDYERRYPFLSRPIIEFVLRLPSDDGINRPLAQKRILREAMRGVLPEVVRSRSGKGSAGSRMLWALDHERKLIEWMLRDPILAQMGCVDAAPLRHAYTEARSGRFALGVPLFMALALETWLRIRSGQWPVRFAAISSSSKVHLQEVS